MQVGVALRRVAGQAMELGECDRALAGRAGHMHLRLQHRQRHAHVRGMRGDAGIAGPEDRVHPVEAVDRRAAAAWLALVARRRHVIEVVAARSLQQIAAGRCHVAQLLRGAGQDRARQDRIALLDQRVIGEVGVRHEGTDAQAPCRSLLDRLERQPGDIDEPRRPLDVPFHQVDQIGAAGDEFRARVGRDLAHGIGNVLGARVLEIDHGLPPLASIACRIAATMLG